MILRPEQIRLLGLGLPLIPANVGGSSKSDSSTQTTTNTQNWVTSEDKRIVASDAAIGISGAGNTVNRTQNDTTNFTDNSATDSGNSTSFTSISTTTDFGSVQAGITGIGNMGEAVVGMSGNAINGAIKSLNTTGENQLSAMNAVFDFATKQSVNSMTTANQVLGYAKETIGKTNEAFADAKQGPEQKIMLAMIGAGAVIAIAFAMKD